MRCANRFDAKPTRRALRDLLATGLLLLVASGATQARPPAPDPEAVALIAELELKSSPAASRDLPGWAVPKRIVVARADAGALAKLRALAPGVEVIAAAEGDALAAQLATAQVYVGMCSQAVLDAGTELRWLQHPWVGVEGCVGLSGFRERGIVLTNMQRTSGIPIAEHAMALALALSRGLPQAIRNQQTGNWNEEFATPMRELNGRTMLVVGLGGIGTQVAQRAHAFGMRVIATRNSSREGPDFVARVGLPNELLALAAQADVVVNAAPLTPATTGIFDARFFAAMKRGGTFINIARGGSVVTADLIAALESGQLAGAGLDVTDPEPLPAAHPLWRMPNVVITPHVAAGSDVQQRRGALLVAENIRRYVAGEPLLNVVDVERGY